MQVEIKKYSPGSNSQILRCKISMEITQKKPKVSKRAKLISPKANQSHKSKKTEECKIDSAFIFTLEGTHGHCD